MVKEIIAQYGGPGRNPKLSIWHFEDSVTNDAAKTALQTFYTSVAGTWSNQYSVQLQPTVREMSSVTGTLTGESGFTVAPVVINGTIAGQPVPDAVSTLFRWNTNLVVAGRFLKGRTFVPGLAVTQLTNGNLTTSVNTSLNNIATTLANDAAAPSIWSQKHGVIGVVQTGTAWGELATQRRRRG